MEALAGLFLQVLKLSQKAGLVKLGHVSLDGTKVKANASKHKAMSYGRVKQEEERLGTDVKELLHCAEEVDEQEDRCYWKGQERVGAAIHRMRQRLPFPLLGLDSDNGSEFINQCLYTYCRRVACPAAQRQISQ